MPKNKWFKIEGTDHETKVAVIKDWIEKDILQPGYLVLSEDYKSFIKRTYENKITSKSKEKILG